MFTRILRKSSRQVLRQGEGQRTIDGSVGTKSLRTRNYRLASGGPASSRNFFENRPHQLTFTQKLLDVAIASPNSNSNTSSNNNNHSHNDRRREKDLPRYLFSMMNENDFSRRVNSSSSFSSFQSPALSSCIGFRPAIDFQRAAAVCLPSGQEYPSPLRIALGGPSIQPSSSFLGTMGGRPIYYKHSTSVEIGRRNFSTEPSGGGSSSSQYKTSAKIPEPKLATSTSMFSLSSFDSKAMIMKIFEITKTVVTFLVKLPVNLLYYMTHHQERRDKIQDFKHHAKKELDHYWTGTKLLMADVRTARDLLGQTLRGSTLTRRERKQLLRTVTDLFRLVPFSMFLIIPAAELALPFALRLFPNMLPSTFQDSLKAEENMKRELQSRIAMAHFFQETLQELAKEQKRIAAKRHVESPDNEIANRQEQSAQSMLEFLEGARQGEMMPPDVIIQYAKYFQDDLTLDNMPRMQLVNMCRYMQLQPYGADSFLRFQLRHRIRQLKEDDQRIIWEGIDDMTKMELREACQERGMRSTGLSKEAYKRSLQQWLDLSVNKSVPISLLIMSRTFFLQEEITRPTPGNEEAKSVASLADAISGMDKEVLNEVILEVATKEEKKSNPDIRKIKLEVVTQQNERIREEREAAEKKKKAAEKVEALPAPAPSEPLAPVELELSPEQAEALVNVVSQTGVPDVVLNAKKTDPLITPLEGVTEEVEKVSTTTEDERDNELSAAEMDAISQLLSADPVSKEREQLARLKNAISENEVVEQNKPEEVYVAQEKIESPMESSTGSLEEQAAAKIDTLETLAAKEADESTKFSTGPDVSQPSKESSGRTEVAPTDAEVEMVDPVVARLKKRLESMVDKIELQLSDVEREIGDKLHILDKDADGVLSQEEMAECLRGVLKREITFEEAMEIAATMDENEDGLFTVQELYNWIETNKLVRFQSEGRDADMDRIMEKSKEVSSSSDAVDPVEAKKVTATEKP